MTLAQSAPPSPEAGNTYRAGLSQVPTQGEEAAGGPSETEFLGCRTFFAAETDFSSLAFRGL